jgi:molecular chaperone GrpE
MTDEDSTIEAPEPTDPDPSNEEDRPKSERDEYYDLLLRKTAEFDNYRKRIERERTSVQQSAAADLISELLPLVDDLERALSVDTESAGADTYRAGVELIHRQLLSLLEKRGVAAIDALGAQFDPEFHQAVATGPADDNEHPDGSVIEEHRRGYTLHGRLLRPAMVKVAKA